MLAPVIMLMSALAAPTIAPEAQPTLDKVFAYYKSLPGASVTLTMKAPMPGMDDQVSTMAAQKPNLFKISQDMGMPGMGNMDLISDGTHAWTVETGSKIYSEHPAPKSFVDSEDIMMLLGGMPGEFFFALLSDDPGASFLEGISKIEASDPIEIDGTTYDAFTLHTDPASNPNMPSEVKILITVQQGDTPWIHGSRISLPKEMTGGMDLDINIIGSDWKKVENDNAAFAYAPSTDYTKVDDVIGELMGSQQSAGDDAAMALVGKPAPAFTLDALDGTSVSLASLKGKTVILDFFATWCGPCKQGLPVLMDIADKRASDGVVLYVVDLDEPAEKVKKFLDKNKWSLNLLLSGESKVADEYKVGGIPHTVVISADGTIQFVEVGFAGKDHAEKTINEAIDKAIASAK
jgi:peroxiredoxin